MQGIRGNSSVSNPSAIAEATASDNTHETNSLGSPATRGAVNHQQQTPQQAQTTPPVLNNASGRPRARLVNSDHQAQEPGRTWVSAQRPNVVENTAPPQARTTEAPRIMPTINTLNTQETIQQILALEAQINTMPDGADKEKLAREIATLYKNL